MADAPAAIFARNFPRGTVLFEENDPGSRMYVIRKGRVRIFRKLGASEVVLAFMGPGDFFGEMALLENLPRSASAEVVEDAVLVEVDSGTFEDMIRNNSEVAVRIMRKLASRVREVDKRLERLLVDNSLGRAVEVLRWLLPQGLLERDHVRIKDGATHIDIAVQAAIPPEQAARILRTLQRAGCYRQEGNDLVIANKQKLDEYASFLDMKRKYEDPIASVDDSDPTRRDPSLVMQRLLKTFSLSHDELQNRQSALASNYQRYLDLKDKYRDIDESPEP